jgi:hypothetical protein
MEVLSKDVLNFKDEEQGCSIFQGRIKQGCFKFQG